MDVSPELLDRARRGEAAALDEIVRATRDLVFNLAIRMLGSPTEAEDATQEILVKLVTQLGKFRGDSAFRTWAYRVAANYLLTTRKRGAEQRVASFEDLGDKLASNLAAGDPAVDDQLLVQEGKLICTSMMLACLDRDHRLAYILGEIFELASEEGAAILEIAPEAFRKRLSRARERMDDFMGRTCGLVDAARPCRCGKQAGHAVAAGLIDPARLTWANRPSTARVADLDGLARAIEVFRSHPRYAAPEGMVEHVRRALAAGASDLLA